MLGDERPGPVRRALVYFGLAAPPDDGLSRPAPREARPRTVARATGDAEPRGGAVRNALGYFGLVDHPDHRPSRYGNGAKHELDRDIDALRARIDELERRLDERER